MTTFCSGNNKMRGLKSTIPLCLMLLVAGCATTPGHLQRAKPSSFGFLNSYQAALHNIEQGEIMEARAKIIAMDKTREDYPAAQKLLRHRIDPSRRKMLQFYLDRARLREKHGAWKLAAQDFGQAAYFSIKPKQWLQQQVRINMRIRQMRFNILRHTLQAEDRRLLAHSALLNPPRQLAHDPLIQGWQEEHWDALEARAQHAVSQASGYLHSHLPELAYAELQSALRLDPSVNRVQELLDETKKSMPAQIKLTRAKSQQNRKPHTASRPAQKTDAATIKRAISTHHWAKARQYALAWRRQRGANADQFLKQLTHQAQLFFDQGRVAVKQEKLPRAVALWQKAVTLAPQNDAYNQALEWALQMQERLNLLKQTNK